MASSWRRSTYSRCDLSMSSATSSRIFRRSSISASVSRAQERRALEPQLDVERLEQLDLALERQVGRVAGGVRERARMVDRAQERDDAAGAARLEDLLDDDAVLACELVRVLADLVGVGVLGDRDAEARRRCPRPGAAELGAVQGADGGAAAPPGSIAGWPSSSATTPIGENWPLRRVAITTRGGPSVANASSKAARASSLVIAIAIAMFGRITPSSRGSRGRMVVLMSLIAEIQTRLRARAFPLDTNMRSPYHRTHVRFALPPPPGLRARRSRLFSSRSPSWPARLVVGCASCPSARRAARRDALGIAERRVRRRHAFPRPGDRARQSLTAR